jgi:glycine hydroxymethyltransferase
MPWPQPVTEAAAIARESGARLVYDAAHVAGLIAGGTFQRPLDEGADVITCSTYKSFGGPPGGLVLTNDPEIARALDRAAYPQMTANYDAGRLASLAVAEAEVLAFWPEYAEACLANARALAGALAGEGFDVAGAERGFTASHHVAIDARKLDGGEIAARRLEPARILLSQIALPWDRPGRPAGGLRMGTQEVARWGLGPREMERIAIWMRRVLLDGEAADRVAREVVELRRNFAEVRYCFPSR